MPKAIIMKKNDTAEKTEINVAGTIFQNKIVKICMAVFIIVAVIFLCYGKIINFGLTELDDHNFIFLCAPSYDQNYALIKAFKANVMFDKYPSLYYRPIVTCAFIIQNKIAGPSVKFAHFSSVFLHIFASVLIFFFLKKYLFSTEISFAAALLFAVHPSAMYSAVWATAIQESILLISFIISLACFSEYIKGVKYRQIFFALHIIFMLICFFDKESAVSFPFIFLLYYFLFKENNQKLQKHVYVIWIASMFFFLYMRRLAGNSGGIGLPHITADNIAMLFDYYYSLVFLRTPFGAVVSTKIFVFGGIAILICAVFAFLDGKKFKIKKINLFYFLLPLLIVGPSIIAGNRLWSQGNRIYPMCFAVIIIFFFFLKPYIENKKTKIYVIIFLAVFMIACASISYKRSEVFRNGTNFWSEILKEAPYNITAMKFHALSLRKEGRLQESLQEFHYLSNTTNYLYDEVNYHFAETLLLAEAFGDAAKVFERIIENKQMLIAQVYAGAVIANYFLNEKDKADIYFNKLTEMLNADFDNTNKYCNSYFQYIHTLKREMEQHDVQH
ncbi:MAG: hypothetical protein LBD46_07165 [Endomicrobium sp.]|jgi:hypothetical protein|nr:hypothetical protein [Endomicrobium sp.]